MYDAPALIAIAVTFLLAGGVKGVVGLGLPTVSLAVLALAFDLPQAMALMLAPSFVTNLWQAFSGGNGRAILRRIWPFLSMAVLTVWFGAAALRLVDHVLLAALLGVLVVLYAISNLAGLRIAISARREFWLGPVLGAVNGVMTGMTGAFVMPGVLYLQAIGFPRDMLIQAMGMLFLVSTLALGVALQGGNFLSMELGAVSLLAVLPAVLGMAIGQSIRRRLSEVVFRQVFFTALLLLGGNIIVNSLGSQMW